MYQKEKKKKEKENPDGGDGSALTPTFSMNRICVFHIPPFANAAIATQ